MRDYPTRKPNRLRTFDYSSPNAYFITLCTKDRICLLGEVVGASSARPPCVKLSEYGRIVDHAIISITERYPMFIVEKHIVMPNHIHLLLRIAGDENGRALLAPRPSKNLIGRCRRARRPSDCNRIAGLCRAGGAVSAFAETIPYIFCGRQLLLTAKNAKPSFKKVAAATFLTPCGRALLAPTVSHVIQQLKGAVTKQIGTSIWQKSFHDHIIRTEHDYQMIWQYIDTNPANWESDCFHAT